MSKEKDQVLARDLLIGNEAIGKFLGLSERAAEWQIKKGHLPIKKMGKQNVASKTVLRKHFASDGIV